MARRFVYHLDDQVVVLDFDERKVLVVEDRWIEEVQRYCEGMVTLHALLDWLGERSRPEVLGS